MQGSDLQHLEAGLLALCYRIALRKLIKHSVQAALLSIY